jgi:serine/threonine protein kinase
MESNGLGHFSLLEKIGEGGMGRVYKARDKRLERFVAIKPLVETRFADGDRRARFVQEAKAASALNHPNIITIHEIGEQDGQKNCCNLCTKRFISDRPQAGPEREVPAAAPVVRRR